MSEENNDDIIPGGSRLQLKPTEFQDPGLVEEPGKGKKRKRKKSREEKKAARNSRKFGIRFLSQSIGTFLVTGLLLGGFLYHQMNDMQLVTPSQANMIRALGALSFIVILVIEAFTEDMMQGILSLFLPPYSFVYGLLFADAGPIRGMTVAVLMFFGAEMYYTPDNALVPRVMSTVGGWVTSGQNKLMDQEEFSTEGR